MSEADATEAKKNQSLKEGDVFTHERGDVSVLAGGTFGVTKKKEEKRSLGKKKQRGGVLELEKAGVDSKWSGKGQTKHGTGCQ